MICKWFKKRRKKVECSSPDLSGTDRQYIYDLKNKINIKRKELFSRSEVIICDNICHEADRRAWDLNSNYSHFGFEQSIRRLKKLGFKYPQEILGPKMEDEDLLVQKWIESPDHKRKLLSKSKYIGIGVSDKFVCVIFAR